MVIYEYRCCKCGEHFEVYQKITEEAFTKIHCPKCGCVSPVTRLVGSSGFKLRGCGWYKDGYTKINTEGNENNERKSV